MPLGHDDQDDRLLALAALVMAGIDPDRPREHATNPPQAEVVAEHVDDLASRRQRRTDEQALARARHPSARRRQSA